MRADVNMTIVDIKLKRELLLLGEPDPELWRCWFWLQLEH